MKTSTGIMDSHMYEKVILPQRRESWPPALIDSLASFA